MDCDDTFSSWTFIENQSDGAGSAFADAALSSLSQDQPREAVQSLIEGIKHLTWRAIARSDCKPKEIKPPSYPSGKASCETLCTIHDTVDHQSTATAEAKLAGRDADSRAATGTNEGTTMGIPEAERYPQEIARILHGLFHDSALLPCDCTPRRSALINQHTCALKLNGSWKVAGNTSHYFFESVLAVDNKYEWKKLQFRIPRKNAKVDFAVQDQEQDVAYSSSAKDTHISKDQQSDAKNLEELDEEMIALTDSCALLEDRTFKLAIPVQLERGLSGYSFYQLNFVHISGSPKDKLSPVPLSKAIHGHMITTRSKIWLAFVLSKAFWQFYASEWTDFMWDFESIVLLPQKLNCHSLDIEAHTPFLSVKAQETQDPVTEQPKLVKVRIAWHRCPRILNLGLLLVLLGTKEGAPSEPLDTLNSTITFCRSQMKNTPDWPHFDSGQIKDEYRRIVRHCVPETIRGISEHPAERRQALLDKVVRPLSDLLRRMQDPIEEVPTSELIGGYQHSGGEDQTNCSRAWLGGTMSAQSLMRAEKWLHDLDELTATLSCSRREDKTTCPPTKVAILDTGITKKYYRDHKDSIHDYKDFVSGLDTNPQDASGHGTSVLRLLLQLYEDAEVYIGRVFRKQDADDETERLMAEAIQHAKSNWKVDVICIPSGFNQADHARPHRDKLYEAIVARPNNKDGTPRPGSLIFAAASNLGLASEVTYPGCLSKSSKVLCLFSTSADGSPIAPGFNPAAVPSAYNLALLGDGIQIGPNDEAVRGTSFSTAIAAAIAAHILDFSNHKDVRHQIKDRRYLREVEGMTSVFASMRSVKQNGYLVLKPWKLQAHARPKELDRRELRQEICRKLSDALTSRDSRKYDF